MYVFPYLVSIRKKIARNDANNETFCFVMWLRFTHWCMNNYFLDYSIKQSKQNNKIFTGKTFLAVLFSSNINEGIRAVLSFLRKDFTHTKNTKRIQANKNKKVSIFMRLKNI